MAYFISPLFSIHTTIFNPDKMPLGLVTLHYCEFADSPLLVAVISISHYCLTRRDPEKPDVVRHTGLLLTAHVF